MVELAAWQRQVGAGCAACAWQQQLLQGAAASRNEGAAWQGAMAAVHDLHFLDSGANSRGVAYPTDPALLQQLGRRCAAHALRLHLHGTPRQWRDPGRPWLGCEAAGLAAAAAAAGVSCTCREYSTGQAPSLDQHFAVIDAFQPHG